MDLELRGEELSGSTKLLDVPGELQQPKDASRPFDLDTLYRFPMKSLGSLSVDRSSTWLIKGLMPSDGIHVIYGAPGVGKSFVALHAALHVAMGRPWGGRPVARRGVIYIAAEGGRGFAMRAIAARQRLEAPHDTPFELITLSPNLGRDPNDLHALIESIEAQMQRMTCEPGLIVLDTLSRTMQGLDESRSEDMNTFVRCAESLAKRFKGLVVPVHHCGKDEEKGMRGSSALHGAVNAEWLVSRTSNDVRSIFVQKMRDGVDHRAFGFSLQTVGLGNDDDGDPIETCVMDFAALPTSIGLKRNAEVLLDAIRVLVQIEGAPHPDAPAGPRVCSEARLRDIVEKTNLFPQVASGSLGTVIPRHLGELGELKLIGRGGGNVWLTAPVG